MHSKTPSDRELYEFLKQLEARLIQENEKGLAQRVHKSARQSVGVSSSEFLGESRLVLKEVLAVGVATDLSPSITQFIDRIEKAFAAVGDRMMPE